MASQADLIESRRHRYSLTVVLVVAHPDDTPTAVLKSLAAQSGHPAFELIVVDGRSDVSAHDCRFGPPDVKRLSRPGCNMPRLKSEGLAVSSGEIVAFLEPKGVPDQNWVTAILRSFEQGFVDALGGCVEFNATRSTANLAAFLFEYSAFGRGSIEKGHTSDLPGNNMAFRRDAFVLSCQDILKKHGLNKPFCQSRLTECGADIRLTTDLCIALETRHRLWPLLTSRYAFARCFSGVRREQASKLKRFMLVIAAPALPLIVVCKRVPAIRHLKGAVRRPDVFLALLALSIAWALGEVVGCWSGAGRACDRLL